MKFYYNTSFPFLINPKDLDPSYKMDLGVLVVLEWKQHKKNPKKLNLITSKIFGIILERGNPRFIAK